MNVELVRAAMARKGLGVRAVARRIHYDHAMLSRVLRGKQRPSEALEAALEELLDLTDEDSRIDYVATHPTRLDRPAVEALASALATQRRADDVVGAPPLLGPAEAWRESLLDMLRKARGPHRSALAAVVAEHSAFLGWLHVQMHSERALSICRESAQLAAEINCGPVRAQALNFEANHWRGKGDLRRSIQSLHAVVTTEGIHPTQRASNLARLAEETARAGEKEEGRRLLKEAEALGKKAAHIDPDPSAYWHSDAYQHLVEGRAHGALGDSLAAHEHIAAGLSGLPAEWQKAPWLKVIKRDYAEHL